VTRWPTGIFGLDFNEQQGDHFAPVRVIEMLTLLFDEDTSFDSHHTTPSTSITPNSELSSSASRRLGLHTAALLGASMTASSMTGMVAEVFIQGPERHLLELTTVPQ
jgi:hypothetical protein